MLKQTIEKGIFLIWIWLGNIISFFKKKKKISLQDVHTIVFNRSDRIGDAIITKPLLGLFRDFISKYNSHIDLQILVSTLNHDVLKDMKWYTIVIKKHILKDSGWVYKEILHQIKNIFIICCWKTPKNTNNIYIDLIWDMDITKEYYNAWYSCLWPNMYLNNFFFDYTLPYHYRWPVIKNLIDCYIDLIEWGFGFHWAFRNYVYDNIQAFYDIDDRIPKKDIMVFVGNKKFKNLAFFTWTVLIHHLSKHFPDETISVIDDDTNSLYNELKQEAFAWNVQLTENIFSLEWFKKFASGFRCILWTDWGGMNFIRNMTNTLILYHAWPENYKVWSWFVWDNLWTWQDMTANNISLHIDNVLGKKFWYMYKKNVNDSYQNHEAEINELIIAFLKNVK